MEDPSYLAKLQMLQTNPQAALATMQSDPRMMETLSFVLGIDLSGAGGPGGPGSAPTEAASASAPAPAAASAPEPAQEPASEEVELRREGGAREEAAGHRLVTTCWLFLATLALKARAANNNL